MNFNEIRTQYYTIRKQQGLEQAEAYLNDLELEPEERAFIFANHDKSQPTTKTKNIEATMIKLQGLRSLPKKKYIIRRLGLSRGNLGLLVAVGGSGKTMLCQYLTTCISAGLPLFGQFPVEKGRAIHVDQEQSQIQTQRRYERIAASLGLESLDIQRWTLNKRLDEPGMVLSEIEDELVKAAENCSLMVIDSLKKCSVAEENSDRIEPVLKMLKSVAERTECAILLIHHKGKGKIDAKQTGRGHSSIYDSVDVQIDLDIINSAFELSCAKNRDGRFFDGIRYQLLDDGEYVEDQDCTEKLTFALLADDIKSAADPRLQILTILAGYNTPIKHSFLYEQVKGDRNAFTKLLGEMVQNKELKMEVGPKNSKLYSLDDNGRALLDWKDDDNHQA